MATPAQWLAGARPRTLPAALAPVLVGTGAAAALDGFRPLPGAARPGGRARAAGGGQLRQRLLRRPPRHRRRPGRPDAAGRLRRGHPAPGAGRGVPGLRAWPRVAGLALAALSSWWLVAVGAVCIAAAWTYTGRPAALRLPGAGRGLRLRLLRPGRRRRDDVRADPHAAGPGVRGRRADRAAHRGDPGGQQPARHRRGRAGRQAHPRRAARRPRHRGSPSSALFVVGVRRRRRGGRRPAVGAARAARGPARGSAGAHGALRRSRTGADRARCRAPGCSPWPPASCSVRAWLSAADRATVQLPAGSLGAACRSAGCGGPPWPPARATAAGGERLVEPLPRGPQQRSRTPASTAAARTAGPDQQSRPAHQRSRVSRAKMPSRPTVYMNSHGRIRGATAGPPVGPVGAPVGRAGGVLSAMTALPLGRQNNSGAGAGDAPDPVQRTDGGLECRDVGHPHLEHVALAAGDPPAVLDLGDLRAGPPRRPVSSTASLSITLTSAVTCETDRGRVDHRSVAR